MSESLVAETCAGKVKGCLDKSSLGPEYYAFRGVPYAEPPIGPLRFADPVPVKSWTGVREATSFGSNCTHINFLTLEMTGSDDCLYLNVYTHSCEKDKRRPVMIWIHGGGFVGGSGDDDLYGPDYFMVKDIVFVSINYRVGILGFLNLEDEVAPGNQGFKDMVLALKWVKSNIANFGGDPNNVTIFGESAGGAAVHYLTISPLARGLFHKAISQSGVALNPWAYQTNPKSKVYRVCEKLGFKSRDPKQIVDYLRSIDSRKLVEAQESILTEEEKIQFTFAFGPGVDAKSKKPFMPISIEEASKEGAQVPLIIGHTNLEGALLAKGINRVYDKLNVNLEKYLNPESVKLIKQCNQSIDDLRRLYYGNAEISEANSKPLFELAGDLYFVEGVHRVVNMQVEAGSAPTYLYRYTFDKEPSAFKMMLGVKASGASHADELPYLFRARQYETMTFDSSKKGTIGHKVMERMIDLWVNFAKTGRPTLEKTEDMPFYWLPVNSGTLLRYLNIDEDLRMEVCPNLVQRFLIHKVTKNKL
ncbi:carboxylesterase clade A, member 6 isoform X1 [Nasonia vitripennis]|uniref:Carboxylic ester hydrolase n=1 Tax=Nasonia vitripennis TaxID=7425 RepID=A0A7M7QXD5_NASVI|nr:carboxylesterase clade A, member 6 [Nasonia vitripennis]XP_032455970.1 carboxylesterase clade A, member 6 isoform X1 [Nasonia vitripennis]